MEHKDTLLSLAEIALALAGFSGVVSVLGSRSEGRWLPKDKLALSFLIENSFLALGGCFLPLALLGFGVAESTTWAWSSGVLAAVLIGANTAGVLRARASSSIQEVVGPWPEAVIRLSLPVGVILMLAWNAVFHRHFGPYQLGVMSFFLIGAIHFVRLLKDPPSE